MTTKTITLPLHVWGRLATVADQTGLTVADVLYEAIENTLNPNRVIKYPEDVRRMRVVKLAENGMDDGDIAVLLEETRQFVAQTRRDAGIYRQPSKRKITPIKTNNRKAEAA